MKRKKEWKVKVEPENIIENKEFLDYINYLHQLSQVKYLYEEKLLTYDEYIKVVKLIKKGK